MGKRKKRQNHGASGKKHQNQGGEMAPAFPPAGEVAPVAPAFPPAGEVAPVAPAFPPAGEVAPAFPAEVAINFSLKDVNFSYLASQCNVNEWNSICVGKLLGSDGQDDVAVCIDMGSGPSKECDSFLHSFNHISYLPIMLITDTPTTFRVIHRCFSSTIEDHVKFLKSQQIVPVLTHTIPDNSATPRTYNYISDDYRMMARSLTDFVLHMHSLDKSFVHLNISNVCVLNGELKIWGVRFKKIVADSCEKDFDYVYEVIDAIFALGGFIFAKSGVQLPVDFDSFISMLRLDSSNDELFRNHFGLLSSKEKITFIKAAGDFEVGLTFADRVKYRQAASDCGPNNGWMGLVKPGPMLNCLHHKGGSNYFNNGRDADVNSSLFHFCRNCATHLHDNIAQSIKYKWSIQSIDLESHIMSHFGVQLTKFKRELTNNGIVHIFE